MTPGVGRKWNTKVSRGLKTNIRIFCQYRMIGCSIAAEPQRRSSAALSPLVGVCAVVVQSLALALRQKKRAASLLCTTMTANYDQAVISSADVRAGY